MMCCSIVDTICPWPLRLLGISLFFFFNDTATTEIYTLSLHDALPISPGVQPHGVHHRRDPEEYRRLPASYLEPLQDPGAAQRSQAVLRGRERVGQDPPGAGIPDPSARGRGAQELHRQAAPGIRHAARG